MTLIIIIITSIFSFIAFSKKELMYKYQFNPYQVYHRKQLYRLVTYAFLHADWMHLIVNMFVLYSFGKSLEMYFGYYFGANKILYFLILYFGGIIVSTLFTLNKHKNNHWYNAVGASGAVSAVVFACIFFAPMRMLLFFGIIPIPGIVFGILYLVYSNYMGKKNVDNVGHDAHFWGAVFGFIFPLIVDIELFSVFLNNLFVF